MRARRGVALLAALWLVVAISVVALQFSLEARDRRTLGIDASERGIERAAALGALSIMHARLEQALRVAPSGTNIARLRAADPWMDVDSVFSGVVYIDSMPVHVRARDLGAQLNVAQVNENQLRTFFQFALGDFTLADKLAQSVMDWRDADSIPRPRGAERDEYIEAEKLALPTNAPFRELTDLADVLGMTPEIYARVSPYLRVRGSGLINLNTAPPLVLRTLPGMTDATLNRILQLRSQGRRISSPAEVFGTVAAPGGRGRGGIAGQVQSVAAQQQLASFTTTETAEVELTITAQVGPQARPVQLIALITRGGSSASVQSRQW
jgi:general secretion pathway protein K